MWLRHIQAKQLHVKLLSSSIIPTFAMLLTRYAATYRSEKQLKLSHVLTGTMTLG